MSILWPHEQVCSQTIKYQVSQCQPYTDILRTICEQTIDNWPKDPLFSFQKWWSSMHVVATLYSCWVVLFASSQYLSTILCMTFHDVGPRRYVFCILKLLSIVFPWFQQKSWILTYPCGLSQCHYLLHTLFEYNPHIRGQEIMLALPGPSRFHFFCYACQFISSTYTDKNCPSELPNKHSQFGTFSQPSSNRTFSNGIFHNSPYIVWPVQIPFQGTTGSSILDHDSGHSCLVDVSNIWTFWLWNFWISLMHLPFWPEYKWILHLLLVKNILEAFM